MIRQFEWWFRGGADSGIAQRFPLLLERARGGELDHWSQWPRPRLALIIVLDQFSRSLFRDTARAFAQDQKALALALEGIEIGHYAALNTPWEKTFFFLPLGHSEQLCHLERAVTLAEELAGSAPPELRKILEHSASQARGHRDVIARFGRHPHRNAILGRNRPQRNSTIWLTRNSCTRVRHPNSHASSAAQPMQRTALKRAFRPRND
jgi:uncharacterized protein (DUF924 family)